MANRDMTPLQFSFEKARKTLDCHLYFGASGAVTLDAQGSKGILSCTQVTTPSQAGTYTINFGVSVNSLNQRDGYVKMLVSDNVPEIEYSGNASPAATATIAIWRDDLQNMVPSFGDVAPVQSAPSFAGADGAFAGGQAFKWLVTAVDAGGNETQISTAVAQEQSGTPAATNHATISWAAVTGASSYNVYRTAAAGASGSENVFVGNTTALTLNDLGTAGTAAYQGGAGTLASQGQKIPNSKLPAYNFARPAYGYNALTIAFYVGTTLTNPSAGEGMRIQIELGDSGAP